MGYLTPLEPADGRRRFSVKSPEDGSEVLQFTVATADDVKAVVAKARTAQAEWAKVSLKERGKRMGVALKLLVERQESYVERLIAETARTEIETLMIEMFATCDVMNFYGRRVHKILADHSPGLHLLKMKRAKVIYKPLGVVGVISPWNGPFILSMNPTVQAVLAGNAVVVKPSEVTPSAGLLVEELFRDAGFPDGLVQVVLGDGETGAALIESGVDKICFTGSVKTGRKVGEACGRNLIPCNLELGGKDPMIVCADADLERAAGAALFGGFMNSGQFCMGIERVYVEESVADTFTAKVLEKVKELRVGRDIRPFIFERQLDIVQRHVDEAKAAGATVAAGGHREGNAFMPTVVTGVTQDMPLMSEETFGPVLPIRRVADVEEAIRLANDTEYGLSAYVFTRDNAKGEAIARRLDTGSVHVNETSMVYGVLEVPFGGVKSSGVGQINGPNGLRNYAHAMPIIFDRFGTSSEAHWYPFTEDKVDGIRKAIGYVWGTPLRWFV